MLSPVPAVLATCRYNGKDNIITIAWTGTICSQPPMLYISVTPQRYSYKMIKETGVFAINIPDKKIVKETDLCGVLSGKNCDKFHETGFTKAKAEKIDVPLIAECPINIECDVEQEVELGSHTMFIAEVLGVSVAERLIDNNNRIAFDDAKLFSYAHGHYYQLGKQLGHFGYSVKKK